MSKIDVSEITTCDDLCEALVNCGWWARNDAQHENIKAVWERIVHLPPAEPPKPEPVVEYWRHNDLRQLCCKTVESVIKDHTSWGNVRLLNVEIYEGTWHPITAEEYEAAKASAKVEPEADG